MHSYTYTYIHTHKLKNLPNLDKIIFLPRKNCTRTFVPDKTSVLAVPPEIYAYITYYSIHHIFASLKAIQYAARPCISGLYNISK